MSKKVVKQLNTIDQTKISKEVRVKELTEIKDNVEKMLQEEKNKL